MQLGTTAVDNTTRNSSNNQTVSVCPPDNRRDYGVYWRG